MIIATAVSKNGVSIRLMEERWKHIVTTHQEFSLSSVSKIMNVVSDPDFILKGGEGELLAVRKVSRKKLWIVVPYRELSNEDGFILTAYFTSDLTWLLKKEIIWNKR